MARPRLVEFLAAGMEYNGEPLASGTVETYDAGTSTPRALYQDVGKVASHTNPATLNSQGALQAYADGNYKFIIKDSDGNTRYTYDNIPFYEDNLIGSFAGATTGSSNAYVATLSPSPVELTEGLTVVFEANHTNSSTTPTLNLNSLGAVTIKKKDESALVAEDIVSGERYTVIYDDSAWLLLNPSESWTSWSPTLTGFSANPTNSVYLYRLVGKTCYLSIVQGTAGTSNSTGFTISLPFTAATISGMVWGTVPWASTDNGSVQTTPAQASISSAGTTIVLAKSISGAGGAWTNASGKAASLMMWYEIA